MKRVIAAFVILLFIAGCGSQSSDGPGKQKISSENLIKEGMNHLGKADVASAIQSFDAAIRQDPSNINNYIILGQVYMRLRNYSRAIDTFSAALRLDPNNGEIFYLLATCQGLDGRIEEAIKSAQQSAEIFIQENDEEKFNRSLFLVQSLMTSEKEGSFTGTPDMME